MSENFACAICHFLIVDPVTLMCQHTFCRHCMIRVRPPACPVCRLSCFVPYVKNNLIEDAIIREVGLDIYNQRLSEIGQCEDDEQKIHAIRAQVWREVAETVMSQHGQQMVEIQTAPRSKTPFTVRVVMLFAVALAIAVYYYMVV